MILPFLYFPLDCNEAALHGRGYSVKQRAHFFHDGHEAEREYLSSLPLSVPTPLYYILVSSPHDGAQDF